MDALWKQKHGSQKQVVRWASGKLAHYNSDMINSILDLAYQNEDGTYVMPSGPCMGWPKERSQPGPKLLNNGLDPTQYRVASAIEEKDTKVKASFSDMTKSLIQNSVKLIQTGRLDQEARDKRMETCVKCKHFIESSKRCSECGCFMEAKTWIAGATCPIGSW